MGDIKLHPFYQRMAPGLVRAAIGALAVLLTVVPQWFNVPTMFLLGNEWIRDGFVLMRATTAAEPRVLLVDIDEASIAKLGPWPWSQGRIADLVEILLTHYSARGVALDIVLPKPGDVDGDKRLALLAEHGPLVLAQAFDFDLEHKRPLPLRDGVLGGASASYRPAGVQATGYVANHAGLARAAHVGNIGFIADPDGALRRVPLVTSFAARQYPALALALVDCCAGAPALSQPDDALLRVDYRRDWSAYTLVSAADVLALAIEQGSAANRLVLVGSSAFGLSDRVATPFAGNRPGLGAQATVLSTLLDRQAGLTPARWPGRLIASLFALMAVVVALLALPRVSALASVALLGGASALWLLLAYAVSAHDANFFVPGPLASSFFLLAVAVPYQWQLTQRSSRHLLDTLRQYVAPAVVKELLRSDAVDPLKPRQRDVTTLIADMEGYTTQVEALPIEAAASLTRAFLHCLTGPVIAHHGTLDKYTGDGLVAFWGAPLPNAEHADLALDAAEDILRRVAALSLTRVAQGYAPLRVRIGIDSGLAMAGDFGTEFRSIYTAVGDSVNTASRLEQAARDFPYDVIVGTGTVARARRHHFLALGERLLRGKEKPTMLHSFAAARAATPARVGAASTEGQRA